MNVIRVFFDYEYFCNAYIIMNLLHGKILFTDTSKQRFVLRKKMSNCKSKIDQLILEYEKLQKSKLTSNVTKGVFPWVSSSRNSTDTSGNFLL